MIQHIAQSCVLVMFPHYCVFMYCNSDLPHEREMMVVKSESARELLKSNQKYVRLKREWEDHVDKCNDCNYDKHCIQCEVGFDEEITLTAYQEAQAHGCNCQYGFGEGAWLREQMNDIYAKTLWDLPTSKQNRVEVNKDRQRWLMQYLAVWAMALPNLSIMQAQYGLGKVINKLEKKYKDCPVLEE